MDPVIEVDEDEHDLARDEILERLGDIDDEAIRVAHAHGAVTAGVIVLASLISGKSLEEFIEHIREVAREYITAIDGPSS